MHQLKALIRGEENKVDRCIFEPCREPVLPSQMHVILKDGSKIHVGCVFAFKRGEGGVVPGVAARPQASLDGNGGKSA
jgi:hypothetical protein